MAEKSLCWIVRGCVVAMVIGGWVTGAGMLFGLVHDFKVPVPRWMDGGLALCYVSALIGLPTFGLTEWLRGRK